MIGMCCCGSCTTTLDIRGCDNLALDGVAITVKDAGGSIVDTGTTNSSGLVVVTIPSTGFYRVFGTKTNFTPFDSGFTLLTLTCGATHSPLRMQPLNFGETGPGPTFGWDCVIGCPDPLQDVSLTLTTITPSYAGTTGTGHMTLVLPGGGGLGTSLWSCFVNTAAYTFFFDGTAVGIIFSSTGHIFPPMTVTSKTCPPSGTWTCSDGAGNSAIVTQ